MAATITKLRAFLTSLKSLRRGRKQHPVRQRLSLEELEPRLAPATVQFTVPGETVNETAGTFSIPVTLSGTVTPTVTTFASGFAQPWGLAADSSGNLYVANYQNGTISKVTPTGVVSGFAAINFAEGMAFDPAGNLYVADTGNNSIDKVTPAGVVSTFLTGLNAQGPVWVACDAAGNVYFTNSAMSGEEVEISKATPAGVVSTFVNNGNYANGLAFDAAGNLYFSNFDNMGGTEDTVDKVSPSGVVTPFASGFSDPAGLAFDAAGNLYVANSYPSVNTVSVVTPAGVVSTFASGFSQPTGLAFAGGNLYVSNFIPGTVSEINGSVTVPFTLGGTATPGTDYSGVTASPLDLATSQTSTTITGTLLSDPGPNRTLTFTLGTPSGAGLGSPAVNTLTIEEPDAIAATSGGGQSATVNTAFASPLVATVTDASGDPLSGITVTFAGPGTGAGVSFPDGNTAITNAQGQASLTVADASAGSYAVTASVSGVATSASFSLTNDPGAPAVIVAASGGGQSAIVDTAFTNPLIVTVTDAQNNPVPGVTVTFAGPGTGAGVSFPDGNTAITNAQGQASLTVTANASAGSYAVTASVSGVATPASFTLTNDPGTVSLSQSRVTVSPTSIQAGSTATVTLTAEDANGNQETGGGLTVAFSLGTGNGSGTFGAVTDHGNGTYTATFTGTAAGNVTILATINHQPVQATASLSIASGSHPPPPPPVISGPVDITSLVGIQLGPLTPVRNGRRKVHGSFEQTLTITNNSPDLIQGPIALVLDNLGPFKRVHHHLVPQATLLDANGTTVSIALGSPFLFASALGDQLALLEAVNFVLDFHTKGSANITFDPVVLVGFAQP
jgi:sugar lactone lactonase YvrE